MAGSRSITVPRVLTLLTALFIWRVTASVDYESLIGILISLGWG
jgi:hypothetical protein